MHLRLSTVRPRRRAPPEHGQIVVLFALILIVLISVAGMLLDGGMASANRRQAQAAADTAALAAAKAIGTGNDGLAAAAAISATNRFPVSGTDCSGVTMAGVVVNNPPTSGSHSGDVSYVEVIVQRAMRTAFAGVVGQGCWMVSARAVAVADRSAVSSCNFCALNNSSNNHTLVLKNSATLRVDGDIYVNSSNGGTTPNVCTLDQWKVCGDGFDVFGTGGSISARSISTVGGWETHDLNIATADTLALKNGAACPEHPQPPSQTQTANVCIHMPVLVDPLNDPSKPGNVLLTPVPGTRPIAGQNGCPSTAISGPGTAGTPALLTLSSGTPVICPGTYFGGIKIQGTARAIMLGGTYVLIGGGFQVLQAGGVDGSAGVAIFSTSGSGTVQSSSPGTDRVPAAVAGKINVRSPSLSSGNQPSAPGEDVTFTMTMKKNGGTNPTGSVDFYDGNTLICGGVVLAVSGGNVVASCTQNYAAWGTRAISAVYGGDSLYNGVGDTFNQTVTTPSGTGTGPFTLLTTGPVELYPPSGGAFGGLTIFQERTSNLVITLKPGNTSSNSVIPDCNASFMTADLTGQLGWKGGCGAIGGLRGTVYAAHSDALVLIDAGGLTYLQVMAGMIEIDSTASARFAYNAPYFANGNVHLVE